MSHTRTCERCGRWLDCDCQERETCECPAREGSARAGRRALLLALLALLALATVAAAECTIVSSYDTKGRLQQCVVCYDAAGHPSYIHCY